MLRLAAFRNEVRIRSEWKRETSHPGGMVFGEDEAFELNRRRSGEENFSLRRCSNPASVLRRSNQWVAETEAALNIAKPDDIIVLVDRIGVRNAE